MKAFKIKWVDSASATAPWENTDDIDFPKTEQISIGFLIKENKDWLIIASSYDGEYDNYASITKILKKCIIKKIEIHII